MSIPWLEQFALDHREEHWSEPYAARLHALIAIARAAEGLEDRSGEMSPDSQVVDAVHAAEKVP